MARPAPAQACGPAAVHKTVRRCSEKNALGIFAERFHQGQKGAGAGGGNNTCMRTPLRGWFGRAVGQSSALMLLHTLLQNPAHACMLVACSTFGCRAERRRFWLPPPPPPPPWRRCRCHLAAAELRRELSQHMESWLSMWPCTLPRSSACAHMTDADGLNTCKAGTRAQSTIFPKWPHRPVLSTPFSVVSH